MKAKEAREDGRVTVADLERTLRMIDAPSANPRQKMDWLTTAGADLRSIRRRIACQIARHMPTQREDPLAAEAVRVTERHAGGYADDGELEEVRERIRGATWGQEQVSSPRLWERIRGMAWLAAVATADVEPALALEKTSRFAGEVARAIEIVREAKRIGGAATDEEIEEAYVRACAAAEAVLGAQLEIAGQVIREWLEG